YTLYHVQRADGSTIEGLLEKQDKRGITMRFMGGGSVFIPSVDSISGAFVPGRSVMPTGLIDSLPDGQVANLIAYIQSLK
ncbi:MAG: putative heme-binding domain-containing protein, partial [Rhodothermales bacterium]